MRVRGGGRGLLDGAAAGAAGAVLAASMVGVAALYDLRERGIPHWALALMGVACAAFLAVRWAAQGAWPQPHDAAWMGVACAVGAMSLRGTLVARGDAAMIAISGVLVPSAAGIPALPVAMLVAALAAGAAHIARTVVPNLAELARTGSIFGGVDEPAIRKAAALLVVRRRRRGERFCFAGEVTRGGRRRLALLPGPPDSAEIMARTEYVISVIPLMVPYFAGSCAVAAMAILLA